MTTMTANKPINVEAQRVAKVVDEQQDVVEILSYLSFELFQEVFKRTEDDLKNIFGSEAAMYLYDEAQCEERFYSTNTIDNVHMIQDLSQFTDPESRRNARGNMRSIEKNILQLVRIFSKKDMRDKLVKEFGVFKNNEIGNFKGSYERMKQLYHVKLGTSRDDYDTVQEQLKEMKTSVDNLV